MSLRALLAALPVALLTACAANPAAIPAETVSAEMYAEYSCETLVELRKEKQAELDELYKSQKTKRIVDGVSNVVLLPGVASLIDDSSKPIARQKGEMNALVREYDRRCINNRRSDGA